MGSQKQRIDEKLDRLRVYDPMAFEHLQGQVMTLSSQEEGMISALELSIIERHIDTMLVEFSGHSVQNWNKSA